MTSVNLRTGGSSNRFGTAEDEKAHNDECGRIAKSMKVQYQVAPRASVTTPAGKVLGPGDEVSASMLSGLASRAPLAIIREWVDQGLVLEADNACVGDGPEAA